MTTTGPVRARCDDLRSRTSLTFSDISVEIIANTPGEVLPALAAVQSAVDSGMWAVGLFSYEAAAGLDPEARVRDPEDGFPLVHVLLAEAPDAEAAPLPTTPPGSSQAYAAQGWTADWTAAEHAERIDRIREAIAAGDTYQTNLTTRLRSRIEGDLLSCYADLVTAQQAPHGVYLDLGRFQVLSASPESFLNRCGEEITCAPMKGTAARGRSGAADLAARAELRRSPKERAENVMIVDLLRNDLSRICRPGSVEVPHLLTAEAFPSVWQLTSTVRGRLRGGIGLPELLAALFPCGSITGAPKLSTMELIARLEDSPRGAYCGALGVLAPAREGHPAQTRLNVAIRTVVVDRVDGSASYGVGGGITWSSRVQDEWAEVWAKSRVLKAITPSARDGSITRNHGTGSHGARTTTGTGSHGSRTTSGTGIHGARTTSGTGPRPRAAAPDPPLTLVETLAVQDGSPRHLEEHLDRLDLSAARFEIPVRREVLRCLLQREAAAVPSSSPGTTVLRLEIDVEGAASTSWRALAPEPPGPVRLALDTVIRDPEAPEVRHKTGDRRLIDAALERVRAEHPAAQDVVLIGPGGVVTETSIAHLVVRIDGTWRTPPLSDGCIPGIGRRLLLESGGAVEASVSIQDLRRAEEVAVVSSVRGRRPAMLLETPPESRETRARLR